MLQLYRNSIIAVLAGMLCAMPVSAIDYSSEYAEDPVHSDVLPRVKSLAHDAQRARQQNIPIMIEFSTEWCEYCRALEQQVLEPMLRSGEYDNRVILRKLMVDDNDTVEDFDGSKISTTRFGHRSGVELYPTIVFFGPDGKEVAERIVGITVLEFVPQKIDKALERARRRISSTPSGETR